jgi:hypothetical protein
MSGAQPFSALSAAPLEHHLAGLGAHPHSKSMSLGAAAVVRLEGPFHTVTSSYRMENSNRTGGQLPLSRVAARLARLVNDGVQLEVGLRQITM